MSKSNRRYRGSRHDATGRSKKRDRFVMIKHYTLRSEAWKSLRCTSRALYVALLERYNGTNNGRISLAVRAAAAELHISKDTATKAFRELQDRELIKPSLRGSFNYKQRHATLWILAEYDYNGTLGRSDYMRWRPKEKNRSPTKDTWS